MKLARVLRAPWVATQATTTRWLIGSVLIADVIAALTVASFGLGMPAVIMLLGGVGLLWVSALPQMLWLTQAANRLRLPSVRRDVNTSLCLYALACVGLPVLLAAVAGGQPGVTAVLAVLTLCLCFLYATLPWIVAVGMSFIPALLTQLPHAQALPAPNAPGFVLWAAPTACVLVLLACLRWWQLQRRENLVVRHLLRPLVLGFNVSMLRQQFAQGGGTMVSGNQLDPLQLIRRRPDWLQPTADLRRTGPAFPQRSLRVALGGSYLPQRWTLRRWRSLLPAGIIWVFAAMIWGVVVPTSLGQMFADPANHALPIGIGVVLALIAVIVPIGFMNYLQLLWRRPDAVLPLLALLPGFGSATPMKRALLEAMLAKPLVILALVWLLTIGSGGFAHLTAPAMALLLLVPILGAGWMVVAVTCHLSGCLRPVARRVFEWTSIPALLILGCLSAGLPAAFPDCIPWLGLAWLVWTAFVSNVGLRAWRTFQASPHAFVYRAA